MLLLILTTLATFLLMEGVTWCTHKFVMHGFLWYLHEDHHQPKYQGFEKNDAFFVVFAIPSIALFYYGTYTEHTYLFFIGLGILCYGLAYFLVHDVLITLGIFSITRLEFDLTVLAATLAVVGYSLNDTIVVSDRIRENFRKIRKATAVEVINESLSQTLWRTINTSMTTMLVLLALFFFGGELIHNFAIALMIGVGIGTYSSIYVAATVMLAMNVDREDLIEPEEGELVDDLP